MFQSVISKLPAHMIQTQITAFLLDYPNALDRAIVLDGQITANASSLSTHYADLASLAARQAMAGTELTIGHDTSDSSKFNFSDVKMFMKDFQATNAPG